MRRASARETRRSVLMAFFPDAREAQTGLELLMGEDLPMDRVSVLGRASSSGDDPLGVYYPGVGERMKGWGKMGAFWGGLWGLLTGAAGMFLVPGLGPLLAAGPVVEALAGAAGGAAVTGGVLAAAGAASQLTVAIHRMGVPEQCLEETRERLDRGEHLLILIGGSDETDRWETLLEESGAGPLWVYPYVGLTEAAQSG
jgi:hypothetical protein